MCRHVALCPGTIYIICDGFNLYAADQIYGPWRQITYIIAVFGPEGNYEDPYLWIDNGVFKAFWYVAVLRNVNDVTCHLFCLSTRDK